MGLWWWGWVGLVSGFGRRRRANPPLLMRVKGGGVTREREYEVGVCLVLFVVCVERSTCRGTRGGGLGEGGALCIGIKGVLLA